MVDDHNNIFDLRLKDIVVQKVQTLFSLPKQGFTIEDFQNNC